MQGTVLGSIICTSVMDKLAKVFYANENLLYMYKQTVKIPVLGMVDDVLTVAKFSVPQWSQMPQLIHSWKSTN